MKILLIYNPKAGHKSGEKRLPQVKQLFTEQDIEIDLQQTEYAGHGTELVRQTDFDKYDGIVVAGGDGMAFELINGYFRNPSEKRIPIGILPIGTGNAFARDLNLDKSRLKESVESIVKNKTRKVDVGRFSVKNVDYYYLNILGFGFVADVSKSAQNLKVFGGTAYLLGVLYQVIFLKPYRLKIKIDDKRIEQENIFVELSNTRYTGVNFLMAPDAKIDDGLLDIVLLKKLPRRRLLKCLPKIYTGEHILLDEVDYFQAKSIKIETDIAKVLTPDGELFGTTPFEVECIQQAVDVFCQ
jgi:diacylglycerol kinase (ATP)